MVDSLNKAWQPRKRFYAFDAADQKTSGAANVVVVKDRCQTVCYVHIVMERPKNVIFFLGLRIFQQSIKVIHAFKDLIGHIEVCWGLLRFSGLSGGLSIYVYAHTYTYVFN